jgi:chemotaxis protein methyltransferase CheR
VHPEQIQWATFYRNLKSASGLDLYAYKQDQLQRRILSMVDSKGLDSLEGFWGYLKQSGANMNWFLDKLAINVSELFRNTEKWVELREKVLPSLLRQSPRLKIWSAGCSFGAEAHSVAIILDKYFPGSHTILGTDIDHAALEQAKSGTFNDADMRGVPADVRSAYFTNSNGVWIANPKLKRYLNFKYGNLLCDTFENGLYEKFFRSLKPGGYLFVGSTERIFNSREVGFETPLPFFYRKPTQGEQVWRNAS